MEFARRLRTIYRSMRVPIDERPIVIYQMGKVGSSSIKYTLAKLFPKRWVTSSHILAPANFDKQAQYLIDRGTDPANEETQLQRTEGAKIYQLIVVEQRKAFFITLVRDPITFNFSRYFQNLHVFFPGVDKPHELPVNQLIDRFWADMHTPSHYDWGHALRWFDQEVKPVLGIDVYQYPFAKESGYSSIKTNKVDLLILKTETPDSTKTLAISDFLQIPDFELQRANEGHRKAYADAYEAFKRQIVVPNEDLEQLLDSRFMHHFYTDAEIDRIYKKWRR